MKHIYHPLWGGPPPTDLEMYCASSAYSTRAFVCLLWIKIRCCSTVETYFIYWRLCLHLQCTCMYPKTETERFWLSSLVKTAHWSAVWLMVSCVVSVLPYTLVKTTPWSKHDWQVKTAQYLLLLANPFWWKRCMQQWVLQLLEVATLPSLVKTVHAAVGASAVRSCYPTLSGEDSACSSGCFSC